MYVLGGRVPTGPARVSIYGSRCINLRVVLDGAFSRVPGTSSASFTYFVENKRNDDEGGNQGIQVTKHSS